MRIASETTLAACERALIELNAAAAAEPLQLPKNLRHIAGGAESALTQVIISWAQKAPEGSLETYLESGEQIADLVRKLPGLVAGLCAHEALGRDKTSIFTLLEEAALARLNQLQGNRPREGYRGSSVEIVCADHLGRAAPYLLYLPGNEEEPRLRPRENFRDLAQWLLERTIPREYRPLVDAEASDAIGGMLFEVFKNTEDHALTDVAGDVLATSIRAVKTNHHALEPHRLARIVEDYPPLAQFCASLAPPAGAAQTHLFELSVLDSGPGFACSWTGRPLDALTLNEEVTAVRECFGRGSAKGQDRFGEGLPHVLRLLGRQRGFLKLRTGRMTFHVDYSTDAPVDAALALTRFVSDHAPPEAAVAGSLMTILFPMRR